MWMRYHPGSPVNKNVVIVGGGLAGLATAIYLARGGRPVSVFEKRRTLGGRAITQLRHGYRFNLGAHAFYRNGAGASVLRELGIPIRGSIPKPRSIALANGEERRLPTGWWSLLATSLLSLTGKAQLGSALWHIRRFGGTQAGSMTVAEWLQAHLSDSGARRTLGALLRLVSYSDHPDTAAAAPVLAQMRVALRGGVLYLDEGWQRIVDSLHSAAVSSGVNFISSSRIVGVDCQDDRVRAVRLGGLELDSDRMDTMSLAYPLPLPEHVNGAPLPADTVVLAVDPATAAELTGEAADWPAARPVTAACLDVALRALPNPKKTFALGIDEPLYFAVHSAWAQLAPRGGVLIHTVKYRQQESATDIELDGDRALRRDTGSAADEQALEGLLDRMQPGWRDVLVHRRFLPSMTVSNALVTPTAPRPGVATKVGGLYIAGDWVGEEGLLSDAALSSARAAAKAILST